MTEARIDYSNHSTLTKGTKYIDHLNDNSVHKKSSLSKIVFAPDLSKTYRYHDIMKEWCMKNPILRILILT
jgi:hypothetical protein